MISIVHLQDHSRLLYFLALPSLFSPAIAVETLERIAKTRRITLGYDDSSLPFSYLDEKSQPIAYSIDVCMKIVVAVKRELRRPDLAIKYFGSVVFELDGRCNRGHLY